MKKFLLACLLCVSAQANSYTFTITGSVSSLTQATSLFSIGDTFSAQLVVDSSATDTRPGETDIGNYTYVRPASVVFSNGYVMNAPSYDYVVANDYYIVPLNATLDSLDFYLKDGSNSIRLGFETRLALDTFSSDAFQVPGNPIVPLGTDWYFRPPEQGGLYVFGSLSSLTVSETTVPDSGGGLSLALGLGLALAVHHRWRRQRPIR